MQSAPGVGSTFTLYLPLAPRPSSEVYAESDRRRRCRLQLAARAAAARPSCWPELDGRKVLLIDDDARNLFAVTSLLERAEMEVVAASTAQEGLEALRDNPDLDLVLMDIMLPGMDGYQATRQIRAMPSHTGAADHRADRQGDAGRSREVPGGGLHGLRAQAGRHQPPAR